MIGWQNLVVERPGGVSELHCVPVMDLDVHLLMAAQCACHPCEDLEQPDMWMHNAFDGRESYERGRKTH